MNTPLPPAHGAAPRLPQRPDPEQLRRQARELLRAWQRGDAQALAHAAPYQLPAPQPARALALLQARPATCTPALRLLLGEAVAVDPHAPLPPWGAPPLTLVAFSSLARVGFEPALLQAMDRLLAAGADPNAGLPDPDSTERPLPVLYGAIARAQSLPMVQRLLAAGADPNDNESLYHAVEQPERGMVAALVAAGARWERTNALGRQLDFDALAHLQQVLALGADANELSPSTGTRPLHHAVQRGRSLAHLQALVAHGADPAATDAHGRTLAWHAARTGRADVLALGWPVAVPGPWQASALNQAAFRGDAPMVALLLQQGARWS